MGSKDLTGVERQWFYYRYDTHYILLRNDLQTDIVPCAFGGEDEETIHYMKHICAMKSLQSMKVMGLQQK